MHILKKLKIPKDFSKKKFQDPQLILIPAVAKNSGVGQKDFFLPRIVIVFTLDEYGMTINDALIISVLKFLYAKKLYIQFYTRNVSVCVF